MLDQDKSSLPAIQKRIPDLIAEYEAKRDGGSITKEGRDGVVEVVETYKGAEVEVQEFHEMIAHMNFVSVVDGNYVHPGLDIETRLKADDVKMRLLRSAWKGVYDGLNIASIAPVKDRKQIELMLANPPEFTRENIGEHFGDYLLAPRYHVLRGLAEAFTELDPAFKSHSKVKVGVSGLPKRIVIENAFSQDNWGTWGYNQQKVRDVINALQVYRGDPRLDYGDLDGIAKEAEKFGEADWPAGRIKRFKNGNAHLFFDQQGLLDVNRGLAEFYGDVLADSPEEQADQVKRRQSTEVSTDLAYFWSSESVVDAMIETCGVREGDSVLEPSCGDGNIMDGVVKYVRKNSIGGVRLLGIEYDTERCDQAKAKGHAVVRANFLEVETKEPFNLIYMNPPFAGRHYLKHIEKAISMLAPGGMIVAVLPATAWYDHKALPGRCYDPDRPYDGRDTWRDLPIGSFRASGTNVCTGIWKYRKGLEDEATCV